MTDETEKEQCDRNRFLWFVVWVTAVSNLLLWWLLISNIDYIINALAAGYALFRHAKP